MARYFSQAWIVYEVVHHAGDPNEEFSLYDVVHETEFEDTASRLLNENGDNLMVLAMLGSKTHAELFIRALADRDLRLERGDHTWQAVAPLGSAGIECPKCHEVDLIFIWKER